jgi:hypothetical protein
MKQRNRRQMDFRENSHFVYFTKICPPLYLNQYSSWAMGWTVRVLNSVGNKRLSSSPKPSGRL